MAAVRKAIIDQQLIWQFEIWRDMTVRCDSLRYDSSRYGEIWQFEIQRDMRVRDMTESSVDNIHSMLWCAVSWYVQFQRLIFTRLSCAKIVQVPCYDVQYLVFFVLTKVWKINFPEISSRQDCPSSMLWRGVSCVLGADQSLKDQFSRD